MIATINIPDDGDIGASCANLCLFAAAEYAERHDLVILSERDETGKVVYWFGKEKT